MERRLRVPASQECRSRSLSRLRLAEPVYHQALIEFEPTIEFNPVAVLLLCAHRRGAYSLLRALWLLFEFLSFIESGLGQSDHNVFVAQPLPFDREGQAGGEIFC